MTTRFHREIRSARGIIVQDGAIALIERHRGGGHFFVFPGGSLEPNEASRDALVREVTEETGLLVEPDRVVAEVTFPDRIQSFWLATVVGGSFGTGTGMEFAGGLAPERGSYRAVWLPTAELTRTRVLPAGIAVEVANRSNGVWLGGILQFDDDLQWWP